MPWHFDPALRRCNSQFQTISDPSCTFDEVRGRHRRTYLRCGYLKQFKPTVEVSRLTGRPICIRIGCP